MSNTEYLTASTSVAHAPDEVFAAIANVRGWWGENVIGDTVALHDEFVFTDDSAYAGESVTSQEGIRYCRFRLTEVVPDVRMVWHVVDSCLTFIADQDEWTGTSVIFDLTATPSGTAVRLTHEGLTADGAECFDACSRGWTYYITQSLPRLIETGTGRPIPKYAA